MDSEQAIKNSGENAEIASHRQAEEEVFVFPATVAQRRFWLLDRIKRGNSALNIPLSARLQGQVDRTILERTVNEIVRRHEVLRTTYRTVDGEVMQVVHPEKKIELDWHDLTGLPEVERDGAVEKLRLEDAERSFDIATGPVLRAGLIKVREDDYVFNLSVHHISCDGMSNGVLIPEVAKIYTALVSGQPVPPELPLQYADFALWQNEWLAGPEATKEREYWQNQLKGKLPFLNLPTDRPRIAGRSHLGTIRTLLLPKSLTEALRKLCMGEDATLFMLIMAVYGELLYRYTGNPDVIIGSPAANRPQTNLEGMVGLFANPLLLRLDFKGNPTMRELLSRVKTVSLDAFAHQAYPFEKLMEEIQTDPHRSGVQWLQAYLVFQKAFMLPQQMPGVTLTPLRSLSPGTVFEWMLGVVERAEGVRLQLEYNTDLFDSSTIDRVLQHFLHALEALLGNLEIRVDQLPLLTPAECQELVQWNDSKLKIPDDSTVVDLFEAQARKTPATLAVTAGANSLSYAELNQKANQLAHNLRANGLKPGARLGVAIAQDSVLHVIAFLGSLKAGACCVLLDHRWSESVLEKNIQAAHLEALLTDSNFSPVSPSPATRVINLDQERKAIDSQPNQNITGGTRLEQPACIRFSTGRFGAPKAVVINHEALVNSTCIAADQFGLMVGDRVMGSFNEILPTLITGASLVLSPGTSSEAGSWLALAHKEQITVAVLPTPRWHDLVRHWPTNGAMTGAKLRLMAVGGENISPVALASWQHLVQGKIRLLDCYYLNEIAGAIAYTDPFSTQETPGRIVIGRPAPNIRVHLLDANLQPLPTGVPGDIYIESTALAAGYLSNSGLKQDDFITAAILNQSVARMLKTGDQGRFLTGKGIELAGKVGDLAKTHEFRLELCELRWLLCQHPSVWDVIILPVEEAGEKKVFAYVTGRLGVPLRSEELMIHVQNHLPAYMVPSNIFVLSEFPLTPTGQFDRNALMQNQEIKKVEEECADIDVSANPVEASLIKIWREILNSRQIGLHDNFFEQGGHSLLATRLLSRVNSSFNVSLKLDELFNHPTLADMARKIELLSWAQKGNARDDSMEAGTLTEGTI